MEFFLNNSYKKSLIILRHILTKNGDITIENIEFLTGSTKRTIKGILTLLINDTKEFGLQIFEDSNKKIHLITTSGNVIQALNAYTLSCYKQSILFLMVKELFEFGYIKTVQFCNDKYISRTTFSRNKKSLSNMLETKGIKISNYMIDGLVGNEFKIRDFYYSFFDMSYQDIEWPFENESYANISRFYKKNAPEVMLNVSELNERKINIILYIMLKRLAQNKMFQEKDNLVYESSKFNLQQISIFIRGFLNEHNVYNEKIIEKEIQYFIFQLYIKDLVDFNYHCIDGFFSEGNELSRIVYQVILEYKKKFVIDELEERVLQNQLIKIHLKFEYGFNQDFSFNHANYIKFNCTNLDFKRIYYNASKIFRNLKKNSDYWEYRSLKNNFVQDDIIIYEYYALFCLLFLKRKKSQKLHITISDTLLRIDQDIIQRQLELVFGKSIIFEKKVEKHTDFYITNRGSAGKKIDTIKINSFSEEDKILKIIHEIGIKKYNEMLDFERNEKDEN